MFWGCWDECWGVGCGGDGGGGGGCGGGRGGWGEGGQGVCFGFKDFVHIAFSFLCGKFVPSVQLGGKAIRAHLQNTYVFPHFFEFQQRHEGVP